MTSMLYSGGMSGKPNLPDALDCFTGKKTYSLRTDLAVNGWMYAALGLSGALDVFFRKDVASWPIALRLIAALAPFVMLLLWARQFSRWIRGVDELHRRITLAASLFATAATLLIASAWNRCAREGVFNVLLPSRLEPHEGWGISSLWIILAMLTALYLAGWKIFNRRYQ